MKIQLLCPAHRQQMQKDVSKAIQFWQVGFDTGQFYRDHMLWTDAIPHLGCAFETNETLLTNQMVESEVSWDWFITSTSLLASSFININCQIQAREVMWLAINRLEKDLQKNPMGHNWVDRYLRQLYSELNNLIAPDCRDKGIGAQVPKAVEPLTLIH
jgi:hypothetical protein